MSRFLLSFRHSSATAQPTLLSWGRNDPFFLPAGAKAFARDNPNAEIHFFDTGHFALETHVDEIASTIKAFLKRTVKQE